MIAHLFHFVKEDSGPCAARISLRQVLMGREKEPGFMRDESLVPGILIILALVMAVLIVVALGVILGILPP